MFMPYITMGQTYDSKKEDDSPLTIVSGGRAVRVKGIPGTQRTIMDELGRSHHRSIRALSIAPAMPGWYRVRVVLSLKDEGQSCALNRPSQWLCPMGLSRCHSRSPGQPTPPRYIILRASQRQLGTTFVTQDVAVTVCLFAVFAAWIMIRLALGLGIPWALLL